MAVAVANANFSCFPGQAPVRCGTPTAIQHPLDSVSAAFREFVGSVRESCRATDRGPGARPPHAGIGSATRQSGCRGPVRVAAVTGTTRKPTTWGVRWNAATEHGGTAGPQPSRAARMPWVAPTGPAPPIPLRGRGPTDDGHRSRGHRRARTVRSGDLRIGRLARGRHAGGPSDRAGADGPRTGGVFHGAPSS